MARRLSCLLCGLVALSARGAFAQTPSVVTPVLSTAPLFSYEDAPATPDADDPAIWLNRHNPRKSLVIGTAKDAGLLVYDLSGQLVQAIRPPNAPRVLPVDPPTPAGVNLAQDRPCVDSANRQTFGRYNNVDIAYDIMLSAESSARRVDVAVVSDRGCDRIRFYVIDPSRAQEPLVDITAPDVPRVFPTRFDQPSALQPSGAIEGWTANPVDDQNTAYGLTVAQRHGNEVFVSSRERGLVRQLRILPAPGGRLTYELRRTFLFDTSFDLTDERGAHYAWTPCREAVSEEPQSEGLVVDSANDTLYVAFETIGLYRLPLRQSLPALVRVGKGQLIEPVTSFGRAYRATPDEDEDEFECEYDPAGRPSGDDIEAPGSPANAGKFIEADLEGLSVVATVPGQTLMLASSQGDSSFHFYLIGPRKTRHLGAFFVDGVGDTDGVHYLSAAVSPRYPLGLLVVQNGEAPEPDDTQPINGFEFDGATQFKYIDFRDTLKALLPLGVSW